SDLTQCRSGQFLTITSTSLKISLLYVKINFLYEFMRLITLFYVINCNHHFQISPMIRILLIISFSFLLGKTAFSQNDGEIQGTLQGTNDTPLAFASVTVYRAADTSLIDYVLSEDDGSFRIRRLPLNTPLRVIASFLGYEPVREDFELTSQHKLKDLDRIQMVPTSQTL